MSLLHLASNLTLITLFFVLGRNLANQKRGNAFLILLIALTVCVAFFVGRRPDLMTWFFPTSELIYYSNLFPLAVSLAAVPAVRQANDRAHRNRIVALTSVLFAVALVPYLFFLLPEAQAGQTRIDENGVCLQTSRETCSPAAIVTLLRHYDMDVTEAEVASLALTKRGIGTRPLGQYRALKQIVEQYGPQYQVRLERLSPAEVTASSHPVLVVVGIPKKRNYSATERDLIEKYAWPEGVNHSVVFLSDDPNDSRKVLIAEPSIGREKWWRPQFDALYRGYALSIHRAI